MGSVGCRLRRNHGPTKRVLDFYHLQGAVTHQFTCDGSEWVVWKISLEKYLPKAFPGYGFSRVLSRDPGGNYWKRLEASEADTCKFGDI